MSLNVKKRGCVMPCSFGYINSFGQQPNFGPKHVKSYTDLVVGNIYHEINNKNEFGWEFEYLGSVNDKMYRLRKHYDDGRKHILTAFYTDSGLKPIWNGEWHLYNWIKEV